MKTKIIPFDLEMAKKIQAGEIKGRICTKNGNFTTRIICFDKVKLIDGNGTTENQIVSLTYNENAREDVMYVHNQKGEVQAPFSWQRGYDLVLEVPDNEPMFNVGDTVSINIINSFYDADFRARYHSKLATVLFINKYGAGVKTIISGDENYFSFNELTFVRRDAKESQFKPFDKVLVRDHTEDSWQCDLFSHKISNGLYACVAHCWNYCIPYEGNENLVGTTDKPKEYD